MRSHSEVTGVNCYPDQHWALKNNIIRILFLKGLTRMEQSGQCRLNLNKVLNNMTHVIRLNSFRSAPDSWVTISPNGKKLSVVCMIKNLLNNLLPMLLPYMAIMGCMLSIIEWLGLKAQCLFKQYDWKCNMYTCFLMSKCKCQIQLYYYNCCLQ